MDIKNEHPCVINLVSLKFKEYTQSRLYQIRLNCFKPYIDLSNTQYMLRFYVWGLGIWIPSRKFQKYIKPSDHINICNHYIYQLSTTKIDAYTRGTRTQALDPDRWAQQGCIFYYQKDTNDATVAENLFPDMLHCTVDSLIEGSLHLSHRRGARWGSVGCGVDCWVYRVGLMILRCRAVMSNWRSRLTRVA